MTEIGGKSFTTEMVRATTSAVESRLGDYAYVKRYIGTVSAIDTTAQTCSVKILGSTTESTGFSVRGIQFPQVGNNVSVCMAGQERWIESVLRNKVSTEPFLYRSGSGEISTEARLKFLPTAAGDVIFATQISGHATQDFYVYGDGKMTWGSGSGAHDTNLYRSGTDILKTDDAFHAASTIWLNASSSVTVGNAFIVAKGTNTGQTTDYLWLMYETATGPVMQFGDGSGSGTRDVNLYRSGANVLRTGDNFTADQGITTKVVAGAVSDGSFTGLTPASGTIAIDTTNSKIYVRVGTTWKSVTVA